MPGILKRLFFQTRDRPPLPFLLRRAENQPALNVAPGEHSAQARVTDFSNLREGRMKRDVAAAAMGAAILAALALGATAQPAKESAHVIVSPQDIRWGPAPAALPAGAQTAVLYGDPAKEGPFAVRMKIPKYYFIPPHTHPEAEVVTILSGKFNLGMGPKIERRAATSLGAGGFVALPAGVAHYVFSDEETILQINATGPWGIDYVDPKDDPRLNIAPAENRGSARRQE